LRKQNRLQGEVVLGRAKKYAGIIKRVHPDKPAAFQPKEILNVLDDEPIIFPEQLKLWEWIATTICAAKAK
jgi:primosomal protein N' (replication factor Y)